jgi:hypothetical protein
LLENEHVNILPRRYRISGHRNRNLAQKKRKPPLAEFQQPACNVLMKFKNSAVSVFAAAFVAVTNSASAVGTFTETFNTNASGWLAGSSTTPTHFTSGGINDSGYISYTSTFTSGAEGPFSSPPSAILFRANDSANASGDAFVGDWLGSDVMYFSIAVRHNYSTDLNFYARFAAPTPAGAAASLAVDEEFVVASNVWTTINIPILNNTSIFSSYGAGGTGETGFNTVFSNINNLQFGFYLPPSTLLTDFRIDIDNASIAVPEPTSALLVGLGIGVVAFRRRR